MGRRIKRRRGYPRPGGWTATRDGAGCLTLRGSQGDEPLRSPDPVARLDAFYLAAAAPDLRWELERVLRRLESLVDSYSGKEHADRRLIQAAWGAVMGSRPPLAETVRALEAVRQLELEFTDSQSQRRGVA